MPEKELVERAGELLDKKVEQLIQEMKDLTGSDQFYIVAMVAVRDDSGKWDAYQTQYLDQKLSKVIEGYIDGIMHTINLYEQGWDKIIALQQEVERLKAEAARCSSQS